MIKSISYNQHEIIENIIKLHIPKGEIDIDCTFGNGSFYSKGIKRPFHCFDIDPLFDYVKKHSSCSMPIHSNTVNSIIFDPPFLTYIKKGREHNSIMGKRFSGYWAYSELEEHYSKTIKEAHRVLNKKGILIIKCQDIIHNHKLHATHINITNWADTLFRLKDLFILNAKNRIGHNRKQQHARVYHSYFMVLEKI